MVSLRTKKHRDFLSEPMGNKEVEKIPGIGITIGGQMKTEGITYAYQVFGHFLVLKKDKKKFCDGVKTFGADNGQSNACYNAMLEWSQQYFE